MNERMLTEIARVTDYITEHSGKIQELPSRKATVACLEKLRRILFPEYFVRQPLEDNRRVRVKTLLVELAVELAAQIRLAGLHGPHCEEHQQERVLRDADDITFAFLARIPRIKEYLATDLEALFQGDPAAYSRCEIILSYPGLYATMAYRVAHELYLLEVPMIPRIMTEHAHSVTGVDIHPGATIGKYFCMDHGTGVVIGATTEIGEHVKIYQGVTLGALSTKNGQELKHTKRHPTICDGATIYAGATILGGDTVIGENAVIGGNAFVINSVPANTMVRMKNTELHYREDA